MYYNDHLPPHFHAEYGEDEAVLPRRAHNMVVEWALLHRAELRENWNRARQEKPLQEIAALD